MTLSAAVIDALVAAGASVEQLAAAVKADLAVAEAARADKRAKDTARQQRSRANRSGAASRDVTVTPRDNCDAPPNDIYSNPPDLSPETSSPPRAKRRADAFPRPDWADEQVWSDFLANRKRKRLPNTATAYRRLIEDIDRISDADWPPGRLLEIAAGKGWGAIYPSIKTSGDETHHGHQSDRSRSYPRQRGGWSARPGMEGAEPAFLAD